MSMRDERTSGWNPVERKPQFKHDEPYPFSFVWIYCDEGIKSGLYTENGFFINGSKVDPYYWRDYFETDERPRPPSV